ncbi:MAG: ATP-binding protein [Candidatus Binatia bacterium]
MIRPPVTDVSRQIRARLPPLESRAEVSLPWLVRLRWGAAVGQLLTIAVTRLGLGIALPLARLLPLVAATGVTNLVLARLVGRLRPVAPLACGAVLGLDTLLLTGLLHATGGPFNPFSVLYLVHIALAAVVLGARWTMAVAGLSVGCYAALFLSPLPLGLPGEHVHGGAFSLHLQGMLVAFVVAAALIAYFVVHLSAAIEARDAEIAAVRERAARHERLAGLTTLAAGAAHELSTPLGTIAIATRELERAVGRLPEARSAPLLEDTRLIRAEVERCRAILDRLASDAGEVRGEVPVCVPVETLVGDVLAGLPAGEAARVRIEGLPLGRPVAVPRRALVAAVSSLVRNGLDATGAGQVVGISVRAADGRLHVTVRDDGPGMTPEVLARALDPFFTTKPPGRGMGLGLFLARTLLDGLGGRLTLDSTPGHGVTAAVELPLGAELAHAG